MVRPRTILDEPAIRAAYSQPGVTLSSLAREHNVDRYVIRRIIDEDPANGVVLPFPVKVDVPAGMVTSRQLSERADIAYRQLDYLIRAGLVEAASGTTLSGNTRLHPATEVPVVALIAQLVGDGMGLRPAHRVARQLATTGTAVLGGIRIHLPEEL